MRKTYSAVTVAALLLVSLPPLVTADTHVVDAGGSGDFLTIQSAVDHANSGDTLRILAGTYVESVVATDKRVVCIGDGIGSTTLRGLGDSPAYEAFLSDSGRITQWFIDMSIEASPASEWAVRWEGRAKFVGCETTGRIGSDDVYGHYGDAVLQQTSATHVTLSGSGASTLEDCVIGDATFSGYYYFDPYGGGTYCYHHNVTSTGTQFSSVSIDCCGFDSSDDDIGHLQLSLWSSCEAAGTVFGSVGADDGARLELQDCTIAGNIDIDPFLWVHSDPPTVIMDHCTLLGDLLINAENQTSYTYGWVELYHNTILGNLIHYWSYLDGFALYSVRSNIVLGESEFTLDGMTGAVAAVHNDFVGGVAFNSCGQDSVYGNIQADPLFCDIASHDLTLQECSPCAGAAHDGGDIGAYGVGCECSTAAVPMTWGQIKSLYR